LQHYRPRIVFNMGEKPDELKLCASLGKSIRAHLGLEAEFFGFIFFDETVRRAARTNGAMLREFPNGSASRSISALAEKITRQWDAPGIDSPNILYEDTRTAFSRLKGSA
jgi:MinD-like ATPase involved in chromosome partitioning or flagellar assembly